MSGAVRKKGIIFMSNRIAVVLFFCVLCTSCAELETFAKQDTSPIKTTKIWNEPFINPIIQAGDLRDKGLWNDPDIHKENGQLALYISSSVDEPFKPPVLPFRAVSTDGQNWTLDPPRPLLTTAGTNFKSLETPSVVKFNGQYHLYFTAVYSTPPGSAKDFAIGHAQSADGINWTVTREPILEATGQVYDWNGFLVSEPQAIVYHNQVYLYFCATGGRQSGNPPQVHTIGLAKSNDGIHFDAPVSVVGQSALYPPEQGYAGYSTPSAIEINGQVHLFYDVAHFDKNANPSWQQIAIHHAVSNDGENDFKQDDAPLLTRDDFPWANGEVVGPTALYEDGKVKLWFAGHKKNSELMPLILNNFKGNEFGINYVEFDLKDL